MKISMRKFASLLAIPLLTAMTGGGSDIGNGTDNPSPETGSAWFVGASRTVHYCYEASPRFGASRESIESAIDSAINTWREYIVSRKVLAVLAKDSGGRTQSLAFVSNIICNGSEDLKFMFGSESDEVVAERARLDHPTAFALRTHFDSKASWGQGVIWLSNADAIDASTHFPNWSDGQALRSILLHELGHVFGVGHVRGTIMDEGLSRQLRSGDAIKPQIDQRNQLIACWHCQQSDYRGRLGYGPSTTRDSDEEVFIRFVGRKPTGQIQAELKMSEAKLTLRISDNIGTKDIELGLDTRASSDAIHSAFDRGERIFKVAWTEGGTMRTADFFNGATVEYGSIKDAHLRTLNLVLEVNSHSLGSPGPLTLRWLENGKAHSLFFADK